MKWQQINIPDLSRKSAIITGANSGLGYQIALALATHHCHVILACRNSTKANAARESILAALPQAKVSVEILDLSNLRSISHFAFTIKAKYSEINLLINNAGVLNAAPGELTADGFGTIMGTNCLGPFALTAQLLPLLEASNSARIVTISSDSHKFVNLNLDDLTNREASPLKSYAKSKLANLLFAFELANRLKLANSQVLSVAAHPGFASTNLNEAKNNGSNKGFAQFVQLGMKLVAQSAADGALPILYAATAPHVANGDFYGPDSWFGLKGHPKKQTAASKAYDNDLAAAFWKRCEELTNVKFAFTNEQKQEAKMDNKMIDLDRKKIAVIGGTGFIGYHVVNDLLQHHYNVTIITRNPPREQPAEWKGRVSFSKLDIQKANADECQAVLMGHQGLVFASGGDPGDKAFWEKNVTAVKQVISGARKAGCDRAVLLGSYFTYFKNTDLALADKHTYVNSRIEQAKVARKAGGSDVSVAMLEIPWVFGVTPGRPSMWKDLIKWLNSRFPLFAPDGGTAAVSVETVARVTVAALEKRSNKNIPVAEGNYTWSELLNMLARTKRTVHRVPNWAMSTVGFVWDAFNKLTRQEFPGLNPRHFLSKVFTRNLFVDLSLCRNLEKELGLTGDENEATQRMHDAFTNILTSYLPSAQKEKTSSNIGSKKSLKNKIAKPHLLKLQASYQYQPELEQSTPIDEQKRVKENSNLSASYKNEPSEEKKPSLTVNFSKVKPFM